MARRILLADDSVTAQNMGRRILHDAGYEVTTVNNGSAALKKIAEQKPDLIILDVYMPGYGGLEVCSRLKENRETQRIPVLLTVGKLEPFKPEEARRVRADSYIVKPFEASELLTALTKLEDKIVPGPEPYKQGRFAKAMAAVEHDDQEKDFGDQETGWKDRLIIPGGKSKPAEPEPEPVPAKGFHSVVREEDFRPVDTRKEFERPIPAGLPQDISPEEIAAIAAAAAKISGKSEEGASEAPAAVAETKPEEMNPPAVAETPAPAAETPVAPVEAAEEKEVPSATFASAPEAEETPAMAPEIPEMPVAPEAVAPPAAETLPEAAASAAAEPAVPAAPAEEDKPAVSDAEVLAALASLTPAGGDFLVPAAVPQDSATAAVPAAEAASFTGPRWIAEAVAISDEESTFLLEHEMEKAHAAYAAFEVGRAMPVTPLEVAVPSNGNGNGHGPSGSAIAEAAPAAEMEVKPEEPVVAASEPVVEPVVEAVASETVARAAETEAFAAAAGAGAAAAETSVTEAQPVASAADSAAGEPEEGSRMREAELAAAWANWRQIRESIVGSQPSPPGLEEPAAEEKHGDGNAAAEAAPAAEEEPKAEASQAAAAPAEDPAEIASIVDNMLAELKPKLMEELKRKLKK